MRDASGQPVSLGSGFFVADDVIATNIHVIAKATHGDAKLVGGSQTYAISGLVGSDEEHDLALLKIRGAKRAALPIGDSEKLSVGDEIYVLGNPEGLEGTLSNGIVSGIRQIGTAKILQITAPISPGSSGGPVLDQQGQVVGVAVATFKGGQNLNFAVPGNYLAKLMGAMTVVRALPSTHRAAQSVFDTVGPSLQGAVLITHRKLRRGEFRRNWELEFSIKNTLARPISNVTILAVYKDASGEPLHSEMMRYPVRIEPGTARRVDECGFPKYGCPIVRDGVFWSNFDRRRDRNRIDKEIAKSGGLTSDADLRFIEMRVLGFRVDE